MQKIGNMWNKRQNIFQIVLAKQKIILDVLIANVIYIFIKENIKAFVIRWKKLYKEQVKI